MPEVVPTNSVFERNVQSSEPEDRLLKWSSVRVRKLFLRAGQPKVTISQFWALPNTASKQKASYN